LTAATKSKRTPAIGDRVFVHREDERAPLHLRGLAGAVVLIEGSNARVHFGDGGAQWVAVDILRIDRRRERRSVRWST
jgi:hypothetical protein